MTDDSKKSSRVALVPCNGDPVIFVALEADLTKQLQKLVGGPFQIQTTNDFDVYMNEEPEKSEKTYNARASNVVGHAFPVHGDVVLSSISESVGLSASDISKVKFEFRL